jgi:hypothetical protein
MRWERHVEKHVKMRNAYKILVRKRKGKRRFGRPRHRSDTARTDVKGTGCELDSAGSG